ncbi:MAG TPA: glycosyltransferase family 1 protein [Candidatus Krumholzibacteria bacterium]|nr:glycosyltransferase family 1 protein [Candidatus Krumholzibacteria bacterium]HRX50419.1 glycosyltransferase family 1 protein [Candidatus Krumholzibacteria bacterium]
MTRRHVVLDATAARPPLTGVGWSMVEVARALAETAPADLRFTLLCEDPEPFAAAAAAGWPLRVLELGHGRGARILRAQTRVGAAAQELRADLLHCLTMPGVLRPPCPLAVTVHDLAYLHVPGTIEGPRRLWYRMAVPRGLARADRILTNSRHTAQEVAAAFPGARDRIRVTPFGTPSWTAGAPRAPEEPAADAPFLFVGALEPRKNLGRILDALELLHARRAEAPALHVVGAPGWRNTDLLARLDRLQEAGLVRWEGHLRHADLQQRLVSARALLLPSLHEGFGFPILEGMALGIPVITSDRGAMREVGGEDALLVDPEAPEAIAAAMETVLDHRGLMTDLVRRGRERAAARTWSVAAEATLAAYREVLA